MDLIGGIFILAVASLIENSSTESGGGDID